MVVKRVLKNEGVEGSEGSDRILRKEEVEGGVRV